MGKLFYRPVEEKPNKGTKLVLDLATARDHQQIGSDICGLTVLGFSTGAAFTLTLIFEDNSSLDLDQTELAAKDKLDLRIATLQLTNTSQTGLSLKLLLGHKI